MDQGCASAGVLRVFAYPMECGGTGNPSSVKLRGTGPRRRTTREGNFSKPCISNRSKATLSELTLNRPLASRHPTERLNSPTNCARLGVAGPGDRRTTRSKTSKTQSVDQHLNGEAPGAHRRGATRTKMEAGSGRDNLRFLDMRLQNIPPTGLDSGRGLPVVRRQRESGTWIS